MPVDPISLEVFKNMFISAAEQMGVALQRTGYSPNIKERRDFSCAVFNPRGRHGGAGGPRSGALGGYAGLGAGCVAGVSQRASSGRHGYPQRPLSGRYPFARHHPGRPGVPGRRRREAPGRVRGQPGPPRRRGRHDPGLAAAVHRAVPGGHHHSSHKAASGRQSQPGGHPAYLPQLPDPPRAQGRPGGPDRVHTSGRKAAAGHRAPVRMGRDSGPHGRPVGLLGANDPASHLGNPRRRLPGGGLHGRRRPDGPAGGHRRDHDRRRGRDDHRLHRLFSSKSPAA